MPDPSHGPPVREPHVPPAFTNPAPAGAGTGHLPAEVPPVPGHRQARVSDADRDETVTKLRRASTDGFIELAEFEERVGLALAATNRGELDQITSDLPVEEEGAAQDMDEVRWTVAVFAGNRRSGEWLPATDSRALAVFGSCRLDLTDVEMVDGITIRAVAVMGGIDIVVPEGVPVDLGGFSFLGGRDNRVRPPRRPSSGPRLRVRAHAILGGVTVRSPRRVP